MSNEKNTNQPAPANTPGQEPKPITVEQGLNTLYAATRRGNFTAEEHEGFLKIGNLLLDTYNRQGKDIIDRDKLIEALQERIKELTTLPFAPEDEDFNEGGETIGGTN